MLLGLKKHIHKDHEVLFFGEMIQMDASEKIWFGDSKTYLHLAIDDALGRVVGGVF